MVQDLFNGGFTCDEQIPGIWTRGMYPLIPADARVTVNPPMLVVDGLEHPLSHAEAERLATLAPSLTGRVPLGRLGLPTEDAALLIRLHEQGAVFDLHVSADSVPTARFCDYLYARVASWRTWKPLEQWPWRGVIARGEASIRYLQGLLVENYHYVRAAAVRQSPLLSHAASPAQWDLVRDFVTGEAAHERYFLESLALWGVPEAEIRDSVPLASTAAFIGLQYRLAHRSQLDYLAGSMVLEVDPAVYWRTGDPYQLWESIYGISPEVLVPVREHIRDDVLSGHASLFRLVALDTAPVRLSLGVALSALASAQTVFEATRLWQRDMYEHYQVGAGVPAKAVL
jgi:hypothetical protein